MKAALLLGPFALRGVYASAIAVVLSGCEPYPGTGSTSSSSGIPDTSGSSSSGAGSGRRPINSEKLCSRLINECKQSVTMDTCRRQFTAILVTETCSDALATGSCTELMSSTSPVIETCFPPCSGTLASCNGDGSITICTTAGMTNVLDCEQACRADGNRAYSGTCGTSHGVQISDRPQCWCQ